MPPANLRIFAEQVGRSESDLFESENVQLASNQYHKLSSGEGEIEKESVW